MRKLAAAMLIFCAFICEAQTTIPLPPLQLHQEAWGNEVFSLGRLTDGASAFNVIDVTTQNRRSFGSGFSNSSFCFTPEGYIVFPSRNESNREATMGVRILDPGDGRVLHSITHPNLNFIPTGCGARKDGSLLITSALMDGNWPKVAVLRGNPAEGYRFGQSWAIGPGWIGSPVCMKSDTLPDRCFAPVRTYDRKGKIAVLEGEGPIMLLDFPPVLFPNEPTDPIYGVTLSPDEKVLYVPLAVNGIVSLDTLTLKWGAYYPGSKATHIAFTGDSLLSYQLSYGKTVMIQDISEERAISFFDLDNPAVSVLAISRPEHDVISVLSGDKMLIKEIPRLPKIRAKSAAAPPYDSGVAPGGLFTLWGRSLSYRAAQTGLNENGRLRTEFEGTKVMIGGNGVREQACPLTYVSPNQINAQLPAEVDGLIPGLTPDVWVEGPGGQKSAKYPVEVSENAPVIFSYPDDGAIIITHYRPEGPFNSRQAKAGEVVSLWLTGLGKVSPAVPAGELASSAPLSLLDSSFEIAIAGMPCDISFAGLAPGFAGLYQINLKIPEASPSGEQKLAVRQAGMTAEYSISVTPAVQ